ncbi:MAG: universal stress protein [Chamaesiphon sp.]|nr:universal stress protein [Chamaesiphon sp.]
MASKIPVHTQIQVAHNLAAAVLETIASERIDLALMGWKGSKRTTPDWIFSPVVDAVIQQATCESILGKSNGRTQFDRWLVPIAGGPNAQRAISLLPALTALSNRPQVSLCQVFDLTEQHPDPTTLDRAAELLRPSLPGAIKKVPLYASYIPTAILNYAEEGDFDAIVLGASRAGILQQVVNGNIPAAISQNSNRTVIIVRGT